MKEKYTYTVHTHTHTQKIIYYVVVHEHRMEKETIRRLHARAIILYVCVEQI